MTMNSVPPYAGPQNGSSISWPGCLSMNPNYETRRVEPLYRKLRAQLTLHAGDHGCLYKEDHSAWGEYSIHLTILK